MTCVDGIHEQTLTPEPSFFHREWAGESASKARLFQESDGKRRLFRLKS